MREVRTAILVGLFGSLLGTSAAAGQATRPWVTDPAGFANALAGHRWVVGTSRQPGLTAAEAEASAERDAAEQVGGSDPAVVAAVRSMQGWIVDRVATSRERPYGTVWQARVLVIDDRERVDAVRHHLRAARAATAAAGAGWTLLVVVGFLVVDGWTRGYLRGRLVAAAGVLASAGLWTAAAAWV